MQVVPRNAAAVLTAGTLMVVGACGGTVTRSGESDTANGTADSTGGHTGGGGASSLGRSGNSPAPEGSVTQCGLLDDLGRCDGFASARPAVDIADVLLVVDGSGSMRPGGEPTNSSRWSALGSALEVVMTTSSDAIHYGLQIFPYPEDPADPIPYECGTLRRCCEMPDHAEMIVPTAHPSMGVPWILEELRAHAPAGAAAVTAALERAYRYFVDGNQAPSGDVGYVLLVTDGGPICNPYVVCDAESCTSNIEELDGCPPEGPSCCDDLPAACLDDAASVDQIAALRAQGVTTIVVGLPGSERYSAVLQSLADAGGFVRPDGSTRYYAVGDENDDGLNQLTSALHEIAGLVLQPCRFAAPLDLDRPDAVSLLVDCVLVPYAAPGDRAEGWHWDDPDDPEAMIITGEVCDRIRYEGVREVHYVFGCAFHPAS